MLSFLQTGIVRRQVADLVSLQMVLSLLVVLLSRGSGSIRCRCQHVRRTT